MEQRLQELARQVRTHAASGDGAREQYARRAWADAGGEWGERADGRTLWRQANGPLTVHLEQALRSWADASDAESE